MQTTAITDLTFLKKFCDNDTTRINKYINLFLSSAIGFRQKMNTALQAKDWVELANQAHAFRSTATMMGMNNSKLLLAKLEEDCRRGNISSTVQEEVAAVMDELSKAEAELTAVAKQ
jgi:HPt (histidine-containing phosphotransfer) domain-containing protein